MQSWDVKELSLDGVSVGFEPSIRSEARPGRASELAAYPLFFPGDMLYTLLDQDVMDFVMRLSRGIRPAFCNGQNFQLGFSDALAVLVHVSQRVVPVRGANEYKHSFWTLGDGDVMTGRKDHVR